MLYRLLTGKSPPFARDRHRLSCAEELYQFSRLRLQIFTPPSLPLERGGVDSRYGSVALLFRIGISYQLSIIKNMVITAIELEIDLNDLPAIASQAIEAQIQIHGEPLRWAITAVDPATNIAKVEAIVIQA